MKKLPVLFFALVFLVSLGFVNSASALQYTDTRNGATIEYSLSFLDSDTAQFTIDVLVAGTSGWYIGAWNVKLFEGSGSSPADISPISVPADWLPTDGDTNTPISIWGWSRSDGQSGFYDSDYVGIDPPGSTPNSFPGNGISLATVGTTTFTFDFSGSGTIYEDDMPFQVGYYGLVRDKYKFSQYQYSI